MSVVALPQTPLVKLTALPHAPSWFQRAASWQGGDEGEGREGLGDEQREEGDKKERRKENRKGADRDRRREGE